MNDRSAPSSVGGAPKYSTQERYGAMMKALQRADAYRALAEAALAAAADTPLERAKAQQQAAAAKWISLAEQEERRAETSRALIETP